jgi:hypothetical protein
MIKRLALLTVITSIACMIAACSVSDRALANSEKRINALKSKGGSRQRTVAVSRVSLPGAGDEEKPSGGRITGRR